MTRLRSLYRQLILLAALVTSTGLATWAVLASPDSIIDLRDDVDLRIIGRQAGDKLGRSAAVGDFNADGHADLAVGVPSADVTGNLSGQVVVFYGSPVVAGRFDLDGHDPDLDIWGATAEGRLGHTLVAADLNGDQIDDLIVQEANGPQDRPTAGATYIFFGGTPTWDAGTVRSAAAAADVAIWGAVDGEVAGSSYAVADLTGDGIDDLVLAAPASDRTAENLINAGAVYVVQGDADLPHRIDLRAEARLTIRGGESQGFLGTSVAVADVTGDGALDLLVGEQGHDRYAHFDESGTVSVFSDIGDQSGVIELDSTDPDLLLWGAAHERAGSAMSAGDVNGDRYCDVLIGAPGASPNGRTAAGAAYLLFGPLPATAGELDIAASAAVAVWGPSAASKAGDAVALIDLGGDGLAEVMVNASAADVQSRDMAGFLAIFYGRARFDQPILDLATVEFDTAVLGDSEFTRGPWWLAAPDLDASGRPDLLVGIEQAGLDTRNQAGTLYGLFDPLSAQPPPTTGPTGTPTATVTSTPRATPSPTLTPSPSSTATVSPTPSPTTTPTTPLASTSTGTPPPTTSAMPSPSPGHTMSSTATATASPRLSPTATSEPPGRLYLPLVHRAG